MENLSAQNPYPARYWEKSREDTITCILCPRHCVLRNGQRGFCFVRQNVNGQLILTTYGRSSGFCIDPIEKKPLCHFFPGTAVLSFGTAGCNLGCRFCQNWDISKSQEFDLLCEEAAPDEIAKAAHRLGCKSVAFTYNDPVIFAEYAIDVAQGCHQHGIKTVAVTAGYIDGEARRDFFAHMDAANVDLKAFSEKFYQSLAAASLRPVLDTLEYIRHKTDVWLEITTLLIPGKNDSQEELEALTDWVAKNLGVDVPLHFSAFHPAFRLLDVPPTPLNVLTFARDIARRKGLRYVYTGNVHNPQGESTFCHDCGKLLIGRNGYTLDQYALKDRNHCGYCGAICAGHFDDHAGTWGSKRCPVQIGKRWT